MDGTAGDAASVSAGTDPSRAAVPDPAPAAVPAWVGRAVWRGIWQLIAAVLITAAALWFAGRSSDLIRYLIRAQLLAFALEPAVMWLHQRRAGAGAARPACCWSASCCCSWSSVSGWARCWPTRSRGRPGSCRSGSTTSTPTPSSTSAPRWCPPPARPSRGDDPAGHRVSAETSPSTSRRTPSRRIATTSPPSARASSPQPLVSRHGPASHPARRAGQTRNATRKVAVHRRPLPAPDLRPRWRLTPSDLPEHLVPALRTDGLVVHPGRLDLAQQRILGPPATQVLGRQRAPAAASSSARSAVAPAVAKRAP
jgi:hypothetical protein